MNKIDWTDKKAVAEETKRMISFARGGVANNLKGTIYARGLGGHWRDIEANLFSYLDHKVYSERFTEPTNSEEFRDLSLVVKIEARVAEIEGLDYLNRWQMYDKLFVDKKGSFFSRMLRAASL
jgi:hypothetical protein